MGPLGWQETLIIFVLALLLFGPKELPKVGKTIAKAIGEFRRASGELKDTWHREMANLEKETEDIKKEAQSLAQTTEGIATEANSYTYNYDSSYDYGAYGYPESSDASGSQTTDSSPVSASATQDADSTGQAAATVAEVAPTPVPAEGTVPAGPVTPAPAASNPGGATTAS